MARPVGRPRNMKDPQELLDLWDKYKEYIDTHPDKENIVTVKGEIVVKETKKPYLLSGFIAYVYRKERFDVTDYLRNNYEEFSQIVTCIRQECQTDQVSGTITGKYKAPNLVARLNNIAEKTENENTNRNIEVTMNLGEKKTE